MPPQKSNVAFLSCKSTIFWAILIFGSVLAVVIILCADDGAVKGPKGKAGIMTKRNVRARKEASFKEADIGITVFDPK